LLDCIYITHGEISLYSPNNKPVGIHAQYKRFGAQKNVLALPESIDVPSISQILA
jgi:hypothetical protein